MAEVTKTDYSARNKSIVKALENIPEAVSTKLHQMGFIAGGMSINGDYRPERFLNCGSQLGLELGEGYKLTAYQTTKTAASGKKYRSTNWKLQFSTPKAE